MSENVLDYKGFRAAIQFSADDDLLVGRLLDIEALVMFSAETSAEVREAFHDAVDEYLEDCKRRSVEPEKPYKGTFNVRVGPELHRDAVVAARQLDESLNAFVCRALTLEIQRQRQVSGSVNAIRWRTTAPLSVTQGWPASEGVTGPESAPFDLSLSLETAVIHSHRPN